ncbi:HIT-like domain-containing protein [Lineolata rhizophorae]|uniref:HIT-like domain-containing protein n=1 Tax=Lineolata rhizophorae TaxID=578093 RepID=A0A6A6PC69_9PEZI|nr:HIT-like domain-containing protein [Lineolata rhizophorae]
MQLGLAEPLPRLVESKYQLAKSKSSLTFSPTHLAVIRTSSRLPFQLRYCPALGKKPPKPASEGPTKKPDPFEDPPEDLLIASAPRESPTHILVLNKFPIIAEHFIVATKANKPQTHALEESDLSVGLACVRAWEADKTSSGRRLFAFFNSGDHSGASQPHRHLQFLPVESMAQGAEDMGWGLLVDSILPPAGSKTPSTLPFAHFAARIPDKVTSAQLHGLYLQLYGAGQRAVQSYLDEHPGSLELHSTDDGSLPISYNLALTSSAMALCPRRAEGQMLRRDDGSEIGFVALNGTILAGTLMVKGEEEFETLQRDQSRLDDLLRAAGIPLDQNRENL